MGFVFLFFYLSGHFSFASYVTNFFFRKCTAGQSVIKLRKKVVRTRKWPRNNKQAIFIYEWPCTANWSSKKQELKDYLTLKKITNYNYQSPKKYLLVHRVYNFKAFYSSSAVVGMWLVNKIGLFQRFFPAAAGVASWNTSLIFALLQLSWHSDKSAGFSTVD